MVGDMRLVCCLPLVFRLAGHGACAGGWAESSWLVSWCLVVAAGDAIGGCRARRVAAVVSGGPDGLERMLKGGGSAAGW